MKIMSHLVAELCRCKTLHITLHRLVRLLLRRRKPATQEESARAQKWRRVLVLLLHVVNPHLSDLLTAVYSPVAEAALSAPFWLISRAEMVRKGSVLL
jgi:hypothetical protein